MKEAEDKWNIFSAAQNLPAVLNDPSRGRQSNLFTKKWGDSFVDKQQVPPTPHLPRVDWNQLELYCKKIGKRYRRHTRLGSVGSTNDYTAPTPGSISPSSSISSLQITENFNYRNINEKLLNDATIRDIPQIFLKQDLDFSKPETFALVFHGLDINFEAHHQEQQEKLSHYLDIVEIMIAKQVKVLLHHHPAQVHFLQFLFLGIAKIIFVLSRYDVSRHHHGGNVKSSWQCSEATREITSRR